MFFPEEPELMEAGILGSKASYGSEDKWIGGSPFESIVQRDETILATYKIPPNTRFGHVDFFFPKSIDMLSKNTNGWIIALMGNSLTAIHIEEADSLEWTQVPKQDYQRLRLRGETIRFILTNGGRGQMFLGNMGEWLNTQADKIRAADSAPLYPDHLFYGPHLQSTYNSAKLTITCNGNKRVLDFTKNEIRDR